MLLLIVALIAFTLGIVLVCILAADKGTHG